MPFIFRPITEVDIRQITAWQYEPPYHPYNLADPPDAADIEYFLDPQNNFYIITNESNELLAFCSFGLDAQVPGGDYRATALDIGLGIRPDLTGQGNGATFVEAVLDFAPRTFAPTMFRVTVAEFNKRALRVWEKAGFRQVQRFQKNNDNQTFIVLVR
ncbi:MAG: GNAT family N-acetyltransferase [Anaerolineae bacterium]|nr:GNAT family N-acetyltransferase [Anaerolineae bacterium]